MRVPDRVWLCLTPVDMRLGIDGLSLLIQSTLGKSPCDGSAYAFCNQRANRIKLLIWDGTGVWLAQRRLHRGHFCWPTADESVVYALAASEWDWLTCGIDWQRLSAKPHKEWRV
jgi:transposase